MTTKEILNMRRMDRVIHEIHAETHKARYDLQLKIIAEIDQRILELEEQLSKEQENV